MIPKSDLSASDRCVFRSAYSVPHEHDGSECVIIASARSMGATNWDWYVRVIPDGPEFFATARELTRI